MGRMSRQKGCRGEREWAQWLRDTLGLTGAHRGRQYKGSPESPDVIGGIPGTHAEVKRVESLNLCSAMAKAKEDCGGDIPYVAHRRNNTPWLITLHADDLQEFARLVCTLPSSENAGN